MSAAYAFPSRYAPAATIPRLHGTWTGTIHGCGEGTGFTDYGNVPMSKFVTEQHGTLFAGHFEFPFNGTGSPSPWPVLSAAMTGCFLWSGTSTGTRAAISPAMTLIELTRVDDEKPRGAGPDTLKIVQP